MLLLLLLLSFFLVDPEDRENKVVDPNPKFECKAKYGQYDHEEYCDWYYNCHDSKATLRECRRGKYYDSHRRKCYQSKDVSCGRRRKPEGKEKQNLFLIEISFNFYTLHWKKKNIRNK